MIASARRRTVALCVVATLAYYGLASFVTPALPYVPVPEGWSHAWPSAESALQSWFGLLDAVTALLSALPVALLLVWTLRGRAAPIGLAIGVTVAAFILVSSIVEYGTKSHVLITAVNQFIWISLALPAIALVLVRWSAKAN